MNKIDGQIGVGAVAISQQSKKYVNEALNNNRLSYGPFSRRLEKEFAEQHGCKYCVLTNSGTSSLQIALACLKEYYNWQDGDEVLCPATTFVATSNIILQNNMTPVFVDVCPETYNIDPKQIEKHITKKTKCMMVVHLYGQPADMDAIMAIAKKHDVKVIEDSAETMFARYRTSNFESIKEGDEVLCPVTTPMITTEEITNRNAIPVFVDIDEVTKDISLGDAEKKLTSRTKAIVRLPQYGQSKDVESFARRKDLQVIEETTDAIIGRTKGKSVGSFGDIGCFSTYACHILVTGVGGLTTTNNPELAVILRSLANHGRDNIYISIDDDKGKSGDELQEVIDRRFNFVRMGYSYRITELEAAVGCGELESMPENMEKRKKIAELLLKRLSKWEKYLQLPRKKDDLRDHSYMMFPLLIKEDANFTREQITLFLEENSIETRHMVSILDQPFYHKLFGKDIEDKYPVAKWIDNNGFYIGCHPEITEEIVEYIGEIFDTFFNRLN